MLNTLQHLQQHEVLSSLDLHFALFIQKLSHASSDELLLAAALTSYATRQGHVCADLAHYADQSFPETTDAPVTPIICPALTTWLAQLQQHDKVIGQASEYKPLILQNQRLYLQRYWQYEQQLAQHIHTRLQQHSLDIDDAQLEQDLTRLFPPTPDNSVDWQRTAAVMAVKQRFAMISGGPGTGKTSTVVRILALLLAQNPNLNIALCAPTGKAAARLQEAVKRAKPALDCTDEIKARIPEQAATLHRLLGTQPHSPYFVHNAGNLLAHDVVVIDEASMVDLALMSKLASAIRPDARWLLLGDKDQLASVAAGSVLGDLCAVATQSSSVLHHNVVVLQKSYRFGSDSDIGQLARAINANQAQQAWQYLHDTQRKQIRWDDLRSSYDGLLMDLKPLVLKGYSAYLNAHEPLQALIAFEQFRILCALRRGRVGVENVNRLVEQILNQTHNVETNKRWYHGRPVMVTENDYSLKLFNGDIGIVMRSEQYSDLQVFFPDNAGGVRNIWTSRLPQHETVYAMTIHKSQGSEFDHVLMILPDNDSPILSRELLYTGVTRAKHEVKLWGEEKTFKHAIGRSVWRVSGLRTYFA